MNREQQRFELAKAYSLKLMEDTDRGPQEVAEASVFLANKVLAELDRTKPQPDADGWIPHRPGDPMPCHEETMCYRKYRSGKIGAKDKAGNYSWSEWIGGVTEIIAWKPAE